MLNFVILLIFYFICATSIVGYGSLFLNLFNKKVSIYDFGYLGIFGLIFSLFISYLSNLFIPHNQIFNSIFIIIGLVSFFHFILKTNFKKNFKDNLKIFYIVFLVIFIALLVFKNHDDFSYYHFVSTYILTQFDMLIGLGQLNHGLRTPSSIFYINSLFYLPIIEYYSFNFTAIFVLGFCNLILLNKINFFSLLQIKKSKKKIIKKDSSVYFSLLTFIFINVFFYRIGEHGTDRSAQILILILFNEILLLFNRKPNKFDLNFKILPLIIFIISLKSFYIFYLAVFIPVYLYYLKYFKFSDLIMHNILTKYSIIFVLIFLFVLSSYFFSSGCLIYPVKITCFENMSWSIPLMQVENMHIWYQQWSKAGAGPNFRISDPKEYIEHFNWVNNWFDIYFFNKVSDYLLGLIFVTTLVYFIFTKISKQRLKIKISKFHLFFYSLIFILFCEWFYNHPSLRYGGYIIIASLFFIPLSLVLASFKIELQKFKIAFLSLLLISTLIFIGRNVGRLDKERKIYNYNPFQNAFYDVNKKHLVEYQVIFKMIKNYNSCKLNLECNEKNFKQIEKKFGKFVFKN